MRDREFGESYRLTRIDEVFTLILEESGMKCPCPGLTMLTLVLSFNAVRAADGPSVTPFEADGVVADVLRAFPLRHKGPQEN